MKDRSIEDDAKALLAVEAKIQAMRDWEQREADEKQRKIIERGEHCAAVARRADELREERGVGRVVDVMPEELTHAVNLVESDLPAGWRSMMREDNYSAISRWSE